MELRRDWPRALRDGTRWWLLLLVLWWLLSGGDSWGVGLSLTLIGAVVAIGLKAPLPLPRWAALPGFLWFFLCEMLFSAMDVAKRALLPTAQVAPGWVRYSLRVQSERQRLLLAALVGLLPGTLASHVENEGLWLHVLDVHHAWRPIVERLEDHLLRMSGGGH